MTARATALRPSTAPVVDDAAVTGVARLRLVAESRLQHPRRVGVIILSGLFVVFVIAAVMNGYALQQHKIVSDTNMQIARAEKTAQDLQSQLAELQSPRRVTADAASVLGMVPAPTPVYLEPRADDDARAAEMPPAPTPQPVATPVTTPTWTATPTTAATPSRNTTPTTAVAKVAR